METQKPGNKTMRQTNEFLHMYHASPEFRVRVKQEAAEQLELIRQTSPAEYEAALRRHVWRMTARDKLIEKGVAGPEPPRTHEESVAVRRQRYAESADHRERAIAAAEKWRLANRERVAEARRKRYHEDEAYREKLRAKRSERTARDREKREAAKLAAAAAAAANLA